jgi:hypothetical protein
MMRLRSASARRARAMPLTLLYAERSVISRK